MDVASVGGCGLESRSSRMYINTCSIYPRHFFFLDVNEETIGLKCWEMIDGITRDWIMSLSSCN